MLRSIAKQKHGIIGRNGVFRGMVPTICREVPSFGAYFGTYFALAEFLEFQEEDYGWSMLAGGLAGMSCWGISYPFDVVKTKYQIDGMTSTKYQNMRDVFRKIYQKNGLPGFLHGFAATMVRAFLVNAITFSFTMGMKTKISKWMSKPESLDSLQKKLAETKAELSKSKWDK